MSRPKPYPFGNRGKKGRRRRIGRGGGNCIQKGGILVLCIADEMASQIRRIDKKMWRNLDRQTVGQKREKRRRKKEGMGVEIGMPVT